MSLRKDLIKLATEKPELRKHLVPILRIGMEFPTEEALKKYLEAHPDADRSRHKVVETKKPEGKKDKAPKEKKTWNDHFSDDLFEALADTKGKGLDEVSKIISKPSSEANFRKLREAVKGLKGPWKKDLEELLDGVESGKFKGEFKHTFTTKPAQVSQVSELFSLLRQAINYDK